MKTLILTAALVACGLLCRAQTKFTGIGIFKIGVDTSIISKYSNNKELLQIENPSDYYDIQNQVTGKKADSQDIQPLAYKISWNAGNVSKKIASPCEYVTQYYIPEYEVAGIKMYNINLKFFKNKLVEFKSDWDSNVLIAMIDKYGKPTTKETKKVINCVYKLTGIKEPHTQVDRVDTWANGNIKAVAWLYTYYTGSCELKELDKFYYSISDPELSKCEKNIEDKQPKIALKDF